MITHQRAVRPANGVIFMTAGRQDHVHPQEQDVVAQRELSSEQILERAILYALDQGTEKLEQSGDFDPFTILIEGEELYVEEHPGESEEQSYASARRTVYQMERLCNAYAFCYDGYVTLDDGTSDALVVEYANKGDEKAQIIVKLYHLHDDHRHFDEALYQVGETETLFSEKTMRRGTGADGPEGFVSEDAEGVELSVSEGAEASEAAEPPASAASATSAATEPVL
jgi:hypothetical protein